MSTLLKRLDKHFTICAAAAAGAAAIGSASSAAIVYTAFNHVIPATTAGTYVDVENGAFSDAGSFTGYDINPWGSSTVSFWNTTGGGTMSLAGSGASNLTAGTLISGAALFNGAGAVAQTSGAGMLVLNADNIFGFKFTGNDALTHYGWMRIHVGATQAIRNFVDYAYDNTANTGINAGAVPGPAGLAAIALGAVGVRSRRRK